MIVFASAKSWNKLSSGYNSDMKNRILLLVLMLMILVCLGPIPSPVCAQGKTMTIEGIPSNRPGMVTCIVCRLEYGSDSFEVKLLDPNTASFKIYGDVSRPGFTITPASIAFDAGAAAQSYASEPGDGLGDGGAQNNNAYYEQGAGSKFLPVIVMTHSSKVPVQIVNTCTNRDTWQPVRFGMTGSDNVITSTFGSPSSTVTGELQFRVPGSASGSVSGQNLSLEAASKESGWSGYGEGDNDDDDEGSGFAADSSKRQHGFIDLQSVLHIFLFLVGFVSVFWLCSFVAKKLKKPEGDHAE